MRTSVSAAISAGRIVSLTQFMLSKEARTMAFNLFGAIISGYIPSGRYTILTEIIFVISAAIIVILKAKTMFIIKDEANVNKFNFKKEFCGICFIMFIVYWIISCVSAIAY